MASPALDPPSTDSMARHLCMLLTIADIEQRLLPDTGTHQLAHDLSRLLMMACQADRVSLFLFEGAEYSEALTLQIVRIARVIASEESSSPESMPSITPFQHSHASLLLAALDSSELFSLGPIDEQEPFYREHQREEPVVARYAAFAPIVVRGNVRAVFEVARVTEQPFEERDLQALSSAARSASTALFGLQREATILALLAHFLPQVIQSEQAVTSLPQRVRQWLHDRRLVAEEREALALATSIAELRYSSPSALEFVQTILTGMKKVLAPRSPRRDETREPSW
jgi:hypothetical protein